MLVKIFLIASLLQCVTSYRSFQMKIPNGDSVPHPCKPNYMWEGVGHFLDQGTGVRNPFGMDFYAAGKTWTVELCRKDSDGDGMTNGQELGDPECTWKENAIPTRVSGLSHPGICDPWDSPTCFAKVMTHPIFKTQEDWMREMCKPDEFVCGALNETGAMNMDVRLPPTPVPAKETTYMCQVYDLEAMADKTKVYHMTAVEPIIDNEYVLHHIVLFGCKDEVEATQPYECGMSANDNCLDFLSVWTVGMAGDCYHPNHGVRLLGTNGYKRVALQFHWNNPEKRSDWTDSSGLRLTYNLNLRTYDAGMLMTGSDSFTLPPRQKEVVIRGRCSSGCTRQQFTGDVYVTVAWNHMHYAGSKMSMEVRRNNTHVTYLTNDPVYSYDSPQLYIYNEEPFKLMPGDEIITTCTFDTYKRNITTFQGDATSDEMCYGFLTFYPKQNMTSSFCTDRYDISYCDATTFPECPKLLNFYSEDYVNNSDMYKELQANCQPFGPCAVQCLDSIKKFRATDPCMTGKYWQYLQKSLQRFAAGWDLLARVASCEAELEKTEPQNCENNGKDDGGNFSVQTKASGILITVMICFVSLFR